MPRIAIKHRLKFAVRTLQRTRPLIMPSNMQNSLNYQFSLEPGFSKHSKSLLCRMSVIGYNYKEITCSSIEGSKRGDVTCAAVSGSTAPLWRAGKVKFEQVDNIGKSSGSWNLSRNFFRDASIMNQRGQTVSESRGLELQQQRFRSRIRAVAISFSYKLSNTCKTEWLMFSAHFRKIRRRAIRSIGQSSRQLMTSSLRRPWPDRRH